MLPHMNILLFNYPKHGYQCDVIIYVNLILHVLSSVVCIVIHIFPHCYYSFKFLTNTNIWYYYTWSSII